MNRRKFLGAMLGLAAAPAVVKAENIMKIWVPSTEIITDPYAFAGDTYTLESWLHPTKGVMAGMWYHVAVTKDKEGNQTKYVNGEKVASHPIFSHFDESVVPMAKDKIIFGDPKSWEGYVSDVRFTKGVARNAGGYTGHIAGHEFHNGIYVGGK